MKNLTRKEEMIILSILNLKEEAFLTAIRKHLSNVTNNNASLTSVHIPLSRLEKGGLLLSSFGESTPERGGRRKKIYEVTKLGLAALSENKRISDLLWTNVLILKTS